MSILCLTILLLISIVSTEDSTTEEFSCTNNTYCHEIISSQYYCHNDTYVCTHKDLFPLDVLDVLTTITIFVGGSIAAGAGIGGGGIFVPVLILIGGFHSKDAIPLSNAVIGGAAIANYIQLGSRRHPEAKRPLIYYDMALLMQPLTLAGTIIGVLFHEILPSFIILLILILVLIFSIVKSFEKGRVLFKAETLRNEEKAKRKLEMKNLKESHSGSTISEKSESVSEKESSAIEKIKEREKKTPWLKILILFGLLAMLIVHSLIVGGKGKSIVGIDLCSTVYWIVYWSIFPLLIASNIGIISYLVTVAKKKEKVGFTYVKGDVVFLPRRAIIIAVLCIAAGILASLIGIGGGMVLSPLMLELGVLPDVTASTSSFMILFTSASSVIQFLVVGRLTLDYALMYGIVGLIASVAGQIALDKVIKKTDRKSITVFSICVVILLAAILLSYTGIKGLLRDINQGTNLGFHNYCE